MIDAENDDDIKVVFAIYEGIELLSATGFRKPLCTLQLSDRPSILSALIDYHLMIKVKTEMDQFKEGLKVLGFMDLVSQNPDVWKPFFVYCNNPLTAGKVINNNLLYEHVHKYIMPRNYKEDIHSQICRERKCLPTCRRTNLR